MSDYVTRKQDGYYQLELIVQGAHCGGCRSRIERGIGELVGVSQVRMNLSTLRLVTTWTGEVLTAGDITTKLSQLGFGSAPYQVLTAQTQSEAELKTLLRAMAVAGFAAMNVMLLSIAVWSGGSEMSASTHSLLHWVSALIALPTVAYSGRTFFSSAWQALKNRQTNMDVPISLALILACALSLYETIQSNPETYFDAAVMLLFLLLIGRFLDAKLRLRTGDAARRLAALQITSATRILKNGSIETVPASSIHPDDTLLIPAGQRIPVDGIIIKGVSDVDVQIVTGETSPKSFGVGGRLYSGTTNLTAPLTLKAVAASSDSFLSEITMLVEAGEQSKSKFVRIADRAARAYVPVVHTIALATFIGWLWAGGDLRVAALNAIAVLIITCPCALGLAVPAVQIVAAGKLFKHGVLIKSGNALERLAKTKSVIFDKTGTLTTGQFTLLNFDEIQPQAIKTAAALAHHSNHPLARALHGYKSDLILTDVEEKPGLGLSGFLKDKPVLFGSADFTTATYVDGAASTAWLKIADDDPILFTFADQLREDAQQAVEDLIALSLRLEMLSGDRNEVVKQAASDLGISQWRGEVTPRQKMNLIHQRWAENYYPLMVGDGINDAPALAAANASASLTGASDISRSASDIILQGDRLSGLPIAINIARQAQSRVIENLTLAVLYNLLAIPLAVFGFVNPLIAALAMSGSSLLVTLNALRISRS
ncbi:heavy metal translocating P-type ATPase [Robiginitomaculum antarcticum]|uniref:heavy metal translocating P-type ATPase n=1 Tax=Robiginitomaculum antarcticum TaxID=437507 RepID=UPI00035C67E5|nr:heavy metal translocating P-type ATPase [Robiginitomaculum antarcticum]